MKLPADHGCHAVNKESRETVMRVDPSCFHFIAASKLLKSVTSDLLSYIRLPPLNFQPVVSNASFCLSDLRPRWPSFGAIDAGSSGQGENSQMVSMIPDGARAEEVPLGLQDFNSVSDIQEVTGHTHEEATPIHADAGHPHEQTHPIHQEPAFIQEEKCEHENEASTDSVASRYHRAVNDSLESTLNVAERTEREAALLAEEKPSVSSSESDFDWNETDESELDEAELQEREQRKLGQLQEHEHAIRHAKRLRKFYLFLMRLSSPVRTAIVGFLGSGITITPAILVWLKFTQLSARNQVLAWSIWLSAGFAFSCVISIIVDTLPSIVMKMFDLLDGTKSETLKTQIQLWMSVRYWTKVAMSFACYWVVLAVMFSNVFHLSEDPYLNYFNWVKKVIAGLFSAGVALLVEKILLQMVKIHFHRVSLKDRLEENKHALWALDRLAAAKGISHSPKKRNSKFLSTFSNNLMSGSRTPRAKDATLVDVPATPKGQSMEGSRPNQTTDHGLPGELSSEKPHQELKFSSQNKEKRRRSSNLLLLAENLTAALNSALKNGGQNGIDAKVSLTHSAKKLARKLFQGLDEDRGGVITRNEFESYFKTASDAAMAFKLFDKDGNGDIDRKEMRQAVVRIYKERSALAISLKDMSSAVAKLDAVLISVACVITIFIWFFIFNSKGTSSELVPMATIILGFSFIFGNAAKNLFESMLFIFSIHPYDVGDLVLIDEVHMFVTEFGLFSTTFQRVDGQVVVAPNSLLISKKHIINIRRSGSMWETTQVMVGFDTPLEIIHEFRTRLRQYVTDNPREWKGGLDVNIDFIQNQNLIQLLVAMEHKANWQDWGARWNRRTLFMKEMKRIMDRLNIAYKLPIQPISFLSNRPGHRHPPSRRQNSFTSASPIEYRLLNF
ncbi:hypothetical protein PCANC_00833 [Puccinia coronata f. sp. avenae]|uniref:EF-hand domain-containing protein n=1 Tax=Puccinia coronata f. sp. avenae TaxID=200324 RepID=A0A2N5W7I1_9BASI|nr:hypothetical protein PCANC_00833 [Puccinia coronata f. sp. avenae]